MMDYNEPTDTRLILMCGLPRSGKTTWAREQGLPIVSRDAIRLALHGERYLEAAEPAVTFIEETMVKALGRAGHPCIIIDECHITAKRRNRWAEQGYECAVKVIPTPASVCVRRADAAEDSVIVPVILRMFENCDVPEILEAEYQLLKAECR